MKLYAFCGIDQFTSEAVVHIATSPSSKNAKTAIKKIIARFGSDIKIINDNGSENMKDVETFLAQMNITQYWTRPYTPKDKPFIERFIGTLQRECLDYHYEPLNVKELSEITNAWLDKYHFYRPHEAPGFLTPRHQR
ncbi:MAG: integrase core domain-containing protein [Spirochaetaceae bacterium]|nr:integrase core domain-containing protein [Spirochaetaceae bacterium]